MFELFPVLQEMLGRRGGDLSGGQQQQLAIARALVRPKLLLLDEPTEGIQPNIVHEIGDIIRRLTRQIGLTVVLVSRSCPSRAESPTDSSCWIAGAWWASGSMDQLDEGLVREYLTV